jgi:hypothetical protein
VTLCTGERNRAVQSRGERGLFLLRSQTAVARNSLCSQPGRHSGPVSRGHLTHCTVSVGWLLAFYWSPAGEAAAGRSARRA